MKIRFNHGERRVDDVGAGDGDNVHRTIASRLRGVRLLAPEQLPQPPLRSISGDRAADAFRSDDPKPIGPERVRQPEKSDVPGGHAAPRVLHRGEFGAGTQAKGRTEPEARQPRLPSQPSGACALWRAGA